MPRTSDMFQVEAYTFAIVSSSYSCCHCYYNYSMHSIMFTYRLALSGTMRELDATYTHAVGDGTVSSAAGVAGCWLW